MKGKPRCYVHMKGKAAKTEAGRARQRLGRMLYDEARRAAGLKAPWGYPKGVPRNREKLMAKAIAVVEEVERAPSSPLARELDELTGQSIAVVKDVLTRKVAKKAYTVTVNGKQKRVEPDMRLLAMQAQVATDIIKAKIRVDETAFKAQQTSRMLPIMEALLGGNLDLTAEAEPLEDSSES